LICGFRAALGAEGVLSAPSEMAVYDCDGYTVERRSPIAVVFPRTTDQVAEVVNLCRAHRCPIVARGAGTSLAGGCLPAEHGVVVMLTRMNRILELRLEDALALVEPGVLNIQLGRELAGTGWHYAPDPSSQIASTIGGNVATNAGGPHTLKYGVTVNHLAGLEAVLSDGSIISTGPVEDPTALDLASLICGSEGTLAIVTKVWVRLTRDPEDRRTLRVAFPTIDDASQTVSQIISAGIIPAALELMDRGILDAVEDAYAMGVPREAGAVLVIEIDGLAVTLEPLKLRIEALCREHEAIEIIHAETAAAREQLWKCRKMAVGAVGRLSPGYILQDGVVPRTKLPAVMRRVDEIAVKHDVRIVNVAHAGDGNVHPILLYDERVPGQLQRVQAASREILEACIDFGGSVTAEHGVGVEKIELVEKMFAPADLEALQRVRAAFDPYGLFNPGKKLPAKVHGTNGATLQATTTIGDRVLDYCPDDMTITVEAGITLAALNRFLAASQQRLPLDPPDAERVTIGEILATNAYGPRRFAYGTARDYLLGARMIDGRGQSYFAGSRVVKNVAGYNLPRAIVGARGAFGTIVEATLMVRPTPTHAAFVTCNATSFEQASALLKILRHGPTTPVAIELQTGRSITGAAARLVVGFEGGEDEVAWMVERLMTDWRNAGGQEVVCELGTGLDERWAQLSRPAEFQVNVLPSELIGVTEAIFKSVPDAFLSAHAGNGVLRGGWSENEPSSAELKIMICEHLRPIAMKAGGNLVMLTASSDPGRTSGEISSETGSEKTLMETIAHSFKLNTSPQRH
jgi:glycolate oxidase